MAFFLAAVMTIGVALSIEGGMLRAAANITGTAYIDYNANGVRDNANGATAGQAIDRGIGNITVRAFAANGNLCDTQTTDVNGGYVLNMAACAGTTFRVEFSNLPAGYQPTQVGANNGTTTQFVSEGGTANLGVNQPGNFCQNNPMLAANCYKLGAYDEPATTGYQTLKGFPYNATGSAATPLSMGTVGQVGTTYGLAYRKADKSLYSAAYMKRHAGLGPGGLGAIYKSGNVPASSGTVGAAPFVTIPNAGTDPHPVSDTNCDSIDGQAGGTSTECWVYDQFSFSEVGKRSLGDMDIFEDPSNPANDALFVVNLNDKQLYKVTDLSGTPDVNGFAAPLLLPNTGAGALPAGSAAGQHQGCALADTRPFALAFYNGVGYLGITCTAQSTNDKANLRAYVYSFDPATVTFATAPMLEFPLNYGRGCTINCNPSDGPWSPWMDTWDDVAFHAKTFNGGLSYNMTYPQPMFSDITFGDDGSMNLGIRDRFGDQTGFEAGSLTLSDTRALSGISMGDTLRVCLVGGVYQLENGGLCDGMGPGPAGVVSNDPSEPQGPGGYEFYHEDYHKAADGSLNDEEEITLGSLGQVPGFSEIVSSGMDVLPVGRDSYWTGGVRRFDTRTADDKGSYQLYADDEVGIFGKANGLGDLEVMCDTAPIEVGNRIWRDANNNGVQDPGEAPIAGVTVHLYNAASTLIGTAVTDSSGNYLFSNRTVNENGAALTDSTGKDYGITGLTPSTNGYTIRLDNSADYTDPARLQGYSLSSQNAVAGNGNDQNDSDATIGAGAPSGSNPPTVTFNTAANGHNNHTYDIGFVPDVSIGNFVWNDTNNNGTVDGSEATQGFNGVAVDLYDNTADANSDGQLSAAEIDAATPVATTTTANDARPGPTNGRPGYYQFTGLEPGKYFVQIAASNFSGAGALDTYDASPVPPGVGDTHDDNQSHGAIPSGGTLTGYGVVSVAIDVQADQEPTMVSGNPDDDNDASSDMTIDFGFWHPFSLGNRVWLDADNSATINAADGVSPGIAGVVVSLLDGSGNPVDGDTGAPGVQPVTTTTDTNGYYRFDNLNAGNYMVEIPASNFGSGQALAQYRMSSIAAAESNNPNDHVDSNDDGINPPNVGMAVRSGVVTLGPTGNEPLNEADVASGGQGTEDAFADMTLDFGFIEPPYKGDTVYFDVNGDGNQDANEPGIPNVTVTMTETATGTVIGTRVTNSQGKYVFNNFAPGMYTITVDVSTVPGGTPTTPVVYNNPPMGPSDAILTDDFGFNDDGALGNQVWIDTNKNGTFDPGEPGVEGVSIDLYQDSNNNGVIDSGEPIIGTTVTDANGQYQFPNLLTDDNNPAIPGAQYMVRVTDVDGKLDNYAHVPGSNSGANNNSQDPDGYSMTLTSGSPGNSNQTGDFGYAANPNLVPPPDFQKAYTVDNDVIKWKLIWINQSNVSNVLTHIEDALPKGTSYVSSSLICDARGTSMTILCAFDNAQNKVVWDGRVGADQGHDSEDTAANEIVLTFATKLHAGTTEVTNQAQSFWDQNGDGRIDDNDGNVDGPADGASNTVQYRRGGLAGTGQTVVGAVVVGGLLIAGGALIVVRLRRSRTYHSTKK